jgi:hypothetical protein
MLKIEPESKGVHCTICRTPHRQQGDGVEAGPHAAPGIQPDML